MNLEPTTGIERLVLRRELEAARVAAVERFRDTPGLQMARRAQAMRDVTYWEKTRRVS